MVVPPHAEPIQMERVNPIKHVGVALVLILLSIAGAIIGIQLITTIGVTPNTSIIGALFATADGRPSAC